VGIGSSVVVVGASVVVVGASVVVVASAVVVVASAVVVVSSAVVVCSAVVVVSGLGEGVGVGVGVEDGVELACVEIWEALGIEVNVLEVGIPLEEEVPEVPEEVEPDSSADDGGTWPPAVASAGQSRF
jgi:hypothetical protein